MKEAIEDLEALKKASVGIESSDEDCDDGKRRIKKYWCKINFCGIKEKVDNCLCARLILAGLAFLMIFSVMYAIYDLETKKQARLAAEKQ